MANRKKEKKLVRVTVSVDPDDYVSMEKLGTMSNLSTARLIRQAMREFLERQSREKTVNIPLENRGTNTGKTITKK